MSYGQSSKWPKVPVPKWLSSSLGRMGVSGKDWGLRAHISGSVMNGALSQWHTCIPGKVEIGRKQAGGGQ